MTVEVDLQLGRYSNASRVRLSRWDLAGYSERLWLKDPTLWFPEPRAEIADRLGWLDLPERFSRQVEELKAFGNEIAQAGFRHAVVLGMGGSSLAPEVFARTFGSAPGRPELIVLDSTHPAAVAAVAEATDPATTLFVVASKSGGTLETMSFFRYFWGLTSAVTDTPGEHFIAITDAGSSLSSLARERLFRRVFLAPTDVGGRYSALSEFGLVPAAIIGADLDAMADSVSIEANRVGADVPSSSNDGLRLGASLGELALEGRDKVTFVTSERFASFPAWIEQLIAESTGKDGRGIIPIGGEALSTIMTAYGQDRVFVVVRQRDEELGPAVSNLVVAGHPVITITLTTGEDLAATMFLLEVAVASAGSVIGIHPFDQPDVQLAKDLARRAMDGRLNTGTVAEIDGRQPDLTQHVAAWLEGVKPNAYVGIHAWLNPTAANRTRLEAGRLAVRDTRHTATTLDFGPRFLHSTGQLHKGGPDSGRFIQIVDKPGLDLAIPETDYGFAKLFAAQSLGDYHALQSRHRRVLRVRLDQGDELAIQAMANALAGA